ncbi:MAG TPA: GcrA family cell cycle regulator [Acetobacteraceae bacterium]
MSQHGGQDWTADEQALVTQLWAEGHSMGQIARRIGRSKNSVVGKAHRLGLPSRPSPIQRAGYVPSKRAKRARRAGSVTLAPLASLVAAPKPPRKSPVPAPIRAPKTESPAEIRPGRVEPCCFIMSVKPVRYCDSPSMGGRPYCPAHWAICHTGTRASDPLAARVVA